MSSRFTQENAVPDLPPFLLDGGGLDWEVLFQVYEFEQYASYAEALTRGEVDFIEQALGLDEGAAVLDVACGGGSHAMGLERRGYAGEGVDASAALVVHAARRAEEAALRARFVQGDMRALAYERQFDAALV